jgi:arsenate reductase
MLFICYPKCTTCQKAKHFLEDHHLPFSQRDIKTDRPTLEELKAWQKKSGLPLRRFFNTSGLQYRALELKDRLPQMREDEQLALLASDGMLVKRPLLITDDTVLVGFREAQWKDALL